MKDWKVTAKKMKKNHEQILMKWSEEDCMSAESYMLLLAVLQANLNSGPPRKC